MLSVWILTTSVSWSEQPAQRGNAPHDSFAQFARKTVAAWPNREGTTSRALERPARISGQKGGEEDMETNGTLSGRGLICRRLDKRQLACVGANVDEGLTRIKWSVAQLAAALRVSRVYIDLARKLSPAKRQAIIDGRDGTSFVALLKADPQLTLPLWQQSTNGHGEINDAEIVALVRKYGTGPVLEACCAVEAA
jgi:hypothetical protein